MIFLKKLTVSVLAPVLAIALALPTFGQDLWQAAGDGDTKAIKQLLNEGKDVNAREPSLGLTPIHIAVMQNQPKALRLLAKQGGDPNSGTADGNTPLHAAVFLGHDKVVKELLRAGADPLVPNGQGQDARSVANLDWQTTQYIASMLQMELVEEEVNTGREKALVLIDKEIAKRARSDIWLAVLAGDEKSVKRLAKKEKDIDAINNQYRASLISLASIQGEAGIVDILADAGANVDVQGEDGATPLLVAAFFGRADVVQTLLDHGADKSLRNNDGTTPWMAAQADMAMVDYIAGLLSIELDYDAVIKGKKEAADLLGD